MCLSYCYINHGQVMISSPPASLLLDGSSPNSVYLTSLRPLRCNGDPPSSPVANTPFSSSLSSFCGMQIPSPPPPTPQRPSQEATLYSRSCPPPHHSCPLCFFLHGSTITAARVVQILSGQKNVTKICLSNPSPLNVGINTFD